MSPAAPGCAFRTFRASRGPWSLVEDDLLLCRRIEQLLVGVRWCWAAPFGEQDGGVVLQPVVLVVEDGVNEPSHGLGRRQLVGEGLGGEVDEPVNAELLTCRVAGLGDAV